ncbi:MAG: tetratricopeptide repeat protein [Bacillota bacterium]
MYRSPLTAGLVAALFLLTACARPSETPAPPPAAEETPAAQPPAQKPPEPQPPATDHREAALAAMRQAAWPEAIAHWERLIAQSPAADNWNDLAYTYLLAGRWQEAIDAANRALALEPEHGPAFYNRGIARLQLKNYASAVNDLRESSLLQPDRFEPHLALAEAYVAQGRYALARHAITEASRLEAGREAIAVEETRIAPLQYSAAKLTGPCDPLYADEQLTLCLTSRSGWNEVYVTHASGETQRLATGEQGPVPGRRAARVELPGGLTGIFLEGRDAGAGISGSREWYLFVLAKGRLQQVVFTGNREGFLPPVSDHLRSAATPRVEGDKILAGYRIDAGAAITNEIVRQFQPDSLTAVYRHTDRYDLKGKVLPPINSSRAAFHAVMAHPEVREAREMLGSLFVAVLMRQTDERFYISVGENQPHRVRFDSHWMVDRATGKVSPAEE